MYTSGFSKSKNYEAVSLTLTTDVTQQLDCELGCKSLLGFLTGTLS